MPAWTGLLRDFQETDREGAGMDCLWNFLSDPHNQATVTWLALGVPVVGAAIWAIIVFVLKNVSFRARLIAFGALSTVTVAVAAGCAVWVDTVILDYCPDCRTGKFITIDIPRANQQIATQTDVVGRASPHRVCYFVKVYVRDLSRVGDCSGQQWRLVDVTQVDGSGNWSAAASILHVARGGEARIRAYLSARPATGIGMPGNEPAGDGLISTDIPIWRQ
nr:hypothetical protein [uncultured Rhodopila sp.]